MTNDASPTVTGPIQTIVKSPLALGMTGLGLAIVGGLLAIGAIFAGLVTGLVDDVAGNNLSIVIFFVGIAFLLIAAVIAVVGLLRRHSKVVPIVTLIAVALPALFILLLRVLATA